MAFDQLEIQQRFFESIKAIAENGHLLNEGALRQWPGPAWFVFLLPSGTPNRYLLLATLISVLSDPVFRIS